MKKAIKKLHRKTGVLISTKSLFFLLLFIPQFGITHFVNYEDKRESCLNSLRRSIERNDIKGVEWFFQNCSDYKNLVSKFLIPSFRGEKYAISHLFIQEKVGLNAKDESGDTVLMIASRAGHFETVELLIENGADVDLQNKYGHTALMIARQYGYTRIVELLEEPLVE